jgi:hypothetical protein
MFKVGSLTREQEKFIFRLGEAIQEIEDQGKALKQRKDQQIWFIDEDHGKVLKLHQKLDKDMPQYKG